MNQWILCVGARYCFFVFALLAAREPGLACSCGGGGPICNSYWNTKAVFVGRVIKIHPQIVHLSRPEGEFDVPGGYLIDFEVTEAFRGVTSKQITIRTGTGGGDCGFQFAEGKDYVVFANRDPLSTGTCSNTSRLDQFKGRIEELRKVASAPPGGRLYGTVRETKADHRDTWIPNARLKGITVTAKGPTTLKTITDENGGFSFNGIPGGEYIVGADLPGRIYVKPERAAVPARGCAELNFFAQPNTYIRGRVTNARGEGLPKIDVLAIPWESRQATAVAIENERLGETDEQGNYEIRGVFPGEYMITASLLSTMGYDRPAYRTQFYPSADWRDAATPISVEEASEVLNIDFTLRGPLNRKDFSVQVVWPDGRPVQKGLIDYAPSDHPFNGFYPPELNSNGTAQIQLLEQNAYLVCAHGLDSDRKPFRSHTAVVERSEQRTPFKIVLDTPGFGECPGWRTLAGSH